MMRRTNYILSTIAALAKLLVIAGFIGNLQLGCTKPETASLLPAASSEPIVFNAKTGVETKGKDELKSLVRLASQKFGVCAWYNPEGAVFGSTGSIPYIKNRRFGCTDIPAYTAWGGVKANGVADPVYYPLDGSLSYFCYAPYREHVGETSDVTDVKIIYEPDSQITSQLTNYLNGSPLICFTPDISTASQIDFLAATPVLKANRGSGAIELDFTQHLTTKIEFWAKYSGSVDVSSEVVVITRIDIRDVIGSEYLYFTEHNGVFGHEWCSTISPVNGTSTMPKATYTLSMDNNSLIVDNAGLESSTAKQVNATSNGITYLLPQIIPEGAYLDVTYQVKNTSGAVLDESTIPIALEGTADWPLGKIVRYTLTLSVKPRKEVTLSTSIIEWIEAGNVHSEQELLY